MGTNSGTSANPSNNDLGAGAGAGCFLFALPFIWLYWAVLVQALLVSLMVLLVVLAIRFWASPKRDFRFEPKRLRLWKVRRRKEEQEKLLKAEAVLMALREKEHEKEQIINREQLREEQKIAAAATYAEAVTDRHHRQRTNDIAVAERDGMLIQFRIDQMMIPNFPRGAFGSGDFEHISALWLRAWGDTNVQVTKKSGDGGIDVSSFNCVAQCKFYADSKVGEPEVRDLVGASGRAVHQNKFMVFFSYASGYSPPAIDYANELGVGLFIFNPTDLNMRAFNEQGEHIISSLNDYWMEENSDNESVVIKQDEGVAVLELQDTNLSYINLISGDLVGANLSGAVLRFANLSGADLTGSDLRKARIDEAILEHAVLRRADLSFTNLRFANLSGADLRRANLSGADLTGANLSGADLRFAKIDEAILEHAVLRGAFMPDGSTHD